MQRPSDQFQTCDAYSTLLSLLGEAVVVFDSRGRVLNANAAAVRLLGHSPESILGCDVKDLFYTVDLSRPQTGQFPFDVDGSPVSAMAKTLDGSFLLVKVKCLPLDDVSAYLLVAYVDVLHDSVRERERLMAEIHHLNERLYGILSIISGASLGEGSFEALAGRAANELQRVMSADAAVIYLSDEHGFTPYGVSDGFQLLGVEKTYLPVGVGVPTLVTRNRRTTRLQLVSPPSSPDSGAIMLDLDMDARFRLRSMLAECCSTIVGTPVFSYDRVVAVVIVGWLAPYSVSSDDVQLLDTVAEFLSVEFAAAVTQMEQQRSSGFASALSAIRDLVRSECEMSTHLAFEIARQVAQVVPSRVLVIESNAYTNTSVVMLPSPNDPQDVQTREFPYDIGDVFAGEGYVEVAPTSQCGMWIGRHTDLSQGYGVSLTFGDAGDSPLQDALLVMRGPLDRPFDVSEQTFLRTLSKEVGSTLHAEQTRIHDAQIARALQSGLRNDIPEKVRGVTTASLYISATESAVVGGDFFDLYELSNDQIVLVMGDVSGKGVEAAAMASLVKTALAAYAWNLLDPAQMLSSLNNLFLNFSRLETFASMVVVSIDRAERRATYCCAGHPPAMLVKQQSGQSVELELLTVQSPIVGAFEGLEYVNGSFDVSVGDVLFLYTDGTTEARNQDGAFFGEDALRDALLRASMREFSEIPPYILEEVELFAGGQLHDDIAMVALRFDDIEPGHPTEPLAPNDDGGFGLEYGDIDEVFGHLFG